MKKILGVLLLLLCMGISGCQWKPADMKQQEESLLEADGEKEDTAEESEDEISIRKAEQMAQKKALLERLYQEDAENPGVYTLPVELDESECVIRIECYENKLLVLSSGVGFHVQLFDLDTGKRIGQIYYDVGYEDMGEGGFLEDGTIWIFVPAEETTYYLTQKLEKLDSEEMPVLYRSLWYCDYQDDILWTLDYEENTLRFYQVETHAEHVFQLEELTDGRINEENTWWNLDKVGGGYAYLSITTNGQGTERYRFSTLTGEMLSDILTNTFAMSCDGYGSYYEFQDKYRIIDYDDPDTVINLEEIDPKAQVISYQQQYLLSGTDKTLKIYDCSSGVCYRGYELNSQSDEEENYLWGAVSSVAVRTDAHQVLFAFMLSQEQKVLLCNLDEIQDEAQVTVERVDSKDITRKIDTIDKKIEKKYGIQIITLEEAQERDDLSGYTLWDNIGILDQLDASETLEEFLDGLPDGMVAEMLTGREETVEICFSGTISGGDSWGTLAYAGAYVTSGLYEMNGNPVFFTRMVADVSLKSVLQTNFAHEWFHLLEDYIWDCEVEYWNFDYQENENDKLLSPGEKVRKEIVEDWEEQWVDLSPEDGYFYQYDEFLAYDEERGIDVYVGEEDLNDVYFIDAYGRTFPKEDRARMFENLYMAGMGEELPACFESPHIRQKAVYLCELIRSCYTSVDTETRNVWEQGLCEEDWEQIQENRRLRMEQ